jgi:DNA-binding NtrC family response regulator
MKIRSKIDSLVDDMLDGGVMLNEALSEFEKLYILKALKRNGKHLSNTADKLGIHRNTLSKRVSGYEEKGPLPKRLISHRSK